MQVINTLWAKFISIPVCDGLTALQTPVVKNAKCQLPQAKRCRTKPPSFRTGRPTSRGVVRTDDLWSKLRRANEC